ncbi:monovalent cation/H(+) antiporter subunit G [Deinococcus yavapaiensis]|uniref:Multicomponent Na+:H+ antiporter subunit G n=1 Tax=Deinococcus yavapaiensis KR-236 TaxID=694435 RepID=A0A318SFG5_9DEIO|nr:monovalent cation/H(+) antiporter subunit G [Deinococcus yavapaiensis]PYE56537.1 multicomponent Na+:H+ antiporter subunit G [Deinococcus yavapaiensis KR-236]
MTEFLAQRDLPILIGAFFVLTAAIGVMRFPDLYTRLHASSKLVTLGSAGIFVGAMFEFASVEVAVRLLAILVFSFMTSPVSGYVIANAAYRRGLTPKLVSPEADEWNPPRADEGEAGSD